MPQNQLQFRIKTIAVKSAELLECIQWSDTACDRKNAHSLALELARLTQELLFELEGNLPQTDI